MFMCQIICLSTFPLFVFCAAVAYGTCVLHCGPAGDAGDCTLNKKKRWGKGFGLHTHGWFSFLNIAVFKKKISSGE